MTGTALNFPIVAYSDRAVAELYDMIHPAGDTSTVRSVFIIDPDNKLRLMLTYPKRGPQLRRDRARRRRPPARTRTPSRARDWRPGDQVIVSTGSVHRGCQDQVRLALTRSSRTCASPTHRRPDRRQSPSAFDGESDPGRYVPQLGLAGSTWS